MFKFRYFRQFIDKPTGNKNWRSTLQVMQTHEIVCGYPPDHRDNVLRKIEKPEWEDVPIVEEEIKK